MRRWMTGLLVGLVACGAPGAEEGPPPAEEAVPESTVPPLVSTLSVRVSDDSVHFRLDVTNGSGAPLVLEFATAERADFAVEDGAGTEVWRWSADRGYAQVMGADTLAAGATRSWEASWAPGDRRGAFFATARLVSMTHPVDLRTEFELTDD